MLFSDNRHLVNTCFIILQTLKVWLSQNMRHFLYILWTFHLFHISTFLLPLKKHRNLHYSSKVSEILFYEFQYQRNKVKLCYRFIVNMYNWVIQKWEISNLNLYGNNLFTDGSDSGLCLWWFGSFWFLVLGFGHQTDIRQEEFCWSCSAPQLVDEHGQKEQPCFWKRKQQQQIRRK